MYRFYKGAEKVGRWKPVSVENQEVKFNLTSVHFATVLAVSEKPKKGESITSDAKYLGPYYIDIDSDAIDNSIKALKRTLAILRANGLEENQMYIWASGKRGFHIIVPMKVFTHDVPVRRLPFIYKQLTLMMKLPEEVDKTVYSSGKGRMWRLPNKKRIDSGTYKVRLSYEEALYITSEELSVLVASPREDKETRVVPIGTSSKFASMYRHAESKAAAVELDMGSVFVDPVTKKALEGKLPPCAVQMQEWEVNEDVGFNAVSLQFAKAVAAFCPGKSEELLDDFSKKAQGQSYNTDEKRLSHVKQAFQISVRQHSYQWACPAALSVLENDSCCENCPISFIRFKSEEETEETEEQGESVQTLESGLSKPRNETGEGLDPAECSEGVVLVNPEAASFLPDCIKNLKQVLASQAPKRFEPTLEYNDFGLLESESGYGFMTKDGTVRGISNFTIKPLKSFIEYVPNLSRDVRTGSLVAVYIDGKFQGNTFLDDKCWNSKAGFISAFTGLSNASFFGKDDDVQKMKAAIMTSSNSGISVRRVHSAGIHRDKVGSEFVFTYVEPDWSVDQFGNQDTYQLSGKVNAVNQLKDVGDLQLRDKTVSTVLSCMIRSNVPSNVAQVMGWTMACFLKQHIFAFRNEFPLLSLHGEPGSGKTSTIGLFAALHGCDYRLESSPINLPTATSFVVWKFIAGSTTLPRLIEEFNKSKMPRSYDIYAENFKACWNQHSVQRGSLDSKGGSGGSLSGAYVQEIPLTGPVALCSEQQIVMPALVERTVQVRYSQAMRKNYSEPFTIAAELISSGALLTFARAAYLEAICTPVSEVRDMINSCQELVSDALPTRPRYSYQVILTGLKFLEKLIVKYELYCLTEFRDLYSEFVAWLKENSRELAANKQISEVDLIMTKLNTMAAVSAQEGSISYLMKGVHYLIVDRYLYLDTLTCHANYLRYASQVDREQPVITNFKEFKDLLKGELYCLSVNEAIPDFGEGRLCAIIKLDELSLKGIDYTGFKGSM